MLKSITVERVRSEYELAYGAMQSLCDEVRENDPESFADEPWSPDGFAYHEAQPDGTLVASRKTRGGPREPDYVWTGAIAPDPHEARWICSEDDLEDEEAELMDTVADQCPGGLGGWS